MTDPGAAGSTQYDRVQEIGIKERALKLVIEDAHLRAVAQAGKHVSHAVPGAMGEKMQGSRAGNGLIGELIDVTPSELRGRGLHLFPTGETARNRRVD